MLIVKEPAEALSKLREKQQQIGWMQSSSSIQVGKTILIKSNLTNTTLFTTKAKNSNDITREIDNANKDFFSKIMQTMTSRDKLRRPKFERGLKNPRR